MVHSAISLYRYTAEGNLELKNQGIRALDTNRLMSAEMVLRESKSTFAADSRYSLHCKNRFFPLTVLAWACDNLTLKRHTVIISEPNSKNLQQFIRHKHVEPIFCSEQCGLYYH